LMSLCWLNRMSVAARIAIAAFGGLAITWSVAALPSLRHQQSLSELVVQLLAGEQYKPAAFQILESQFEVDSALTKRSSSLGKLAIVRLRRAELALASGKRGEIDSNLNSLHNPVVDALGNE